MASASRLKLTFIVLRLDSPRRPHLPAPRGLAVGCRLCGRNGPLFLRSRFGWVRFCCCFRCRLGRRAVRRRELRYGLCRTRFCCQQVSVYAWQGMHKCGPAAAASGAGVSLGASADGACSASGVACSGGAVASSAILGCSAHVRALLCPFPGGEPPATAAPLSQQWPSRRSPRASCPGHFQRLWLCSSAINRFVFYD